MRTEKRCKICGEWFDTKKIAMHYWNIHKKKYGEFKGKDEETRTVEEPVEEKMEIENEKKTTEEKTDTTTTTTTRENWKDENQEVINEIFRSYKIVNKHDLLDEGEVINEWC